MVIVNQKKPYLLTKVIDKETLEIIDKKYNNREIMKKICLLNEFEKNINYKNNIDNILIDKKENNSNINMFEEYSSDSDEEDFDPYFIKKEKTDSLINTLNEMEIKNIKSIVMKCLSGKCSEYETWVSRYVFEKYRR